jgi:hypothetical protein
MTMKKEKTEMQNEYEQLAKAYAEAQQNLKQTVVLIGAEMNAVKRRRLAKLRAAVAKAKDTGDALLAAVAESPLQFRKPKSQTVHGVKFGWKKQKGKIEIANEEQTIKLIRKHLPELADALIATTEKPSKEAMNNLSADQLKKIGVTVTSDTDVAFISSVDSEVDKIVAALLKGAEEEVAA